MERPTKEVTLKRLRKAIDAIPTLITLKRNSSDFNRWHRDTEVAIENTFGDKTRHINDFKRVNFSLSFFSEYEEDYQEAYLKGLEDASSVLKSMEEEVEEYWEEENNLHTEETIRTNNATASSKNIFIIHGHDDGTKEKIARFITMLGLAPIILHEKPNKGQTIFEKFEENADVGYAIALLTPDDVGSISSDKQNPNNLKPRARQNVIFELGYFMGKLGRNKVCAIRSGGIEIPSDYQGILYIPMDQTDGWKLKLATEIKHAGIDIDLNKIL